MADNENEDSDPQEKNFQITNEDELNLLEDIDSDETQSDLEDEIRSIFDDEEVQAGLVDDDILSELENEIQSIFGHEEIEKQTELETGVAEQDVEAFQTESEDDVELDSVLDDEGVEQSSVSVEPEIQPDAGASSVELDNTEIESILDDETFQEPPTDEIDEPDLKDAEVSSVLDDADIQPILDAKQAQQATDSEETGSIMEDVVSETELDDAQNQSFVDAEQAQQAPDSEEAGSNMKNEDSESELDDAEIQSILDEEDLPDSVSENEEPGAELDIESEIEEEAFDSELAAEEIEPEEIDEDFQLGSDYEEFETDAEEERQLALDEDEFEAGQNDEPSQLELNDEALLYGQEEADDELLQDVARATHEVDVTGVQDEAGEEKGQVKAQKTVFTGLVLTGIPSAAVIVVSVVLFFVFSSDMESETQLMEVALVEEEPEIPELVEAPATTKEDLFPEAPEMPDLADIEQTQPEELVADKDDSSGSDIDIIEPVVELLYEVEETEVLERADEVVIEPEEQPAEEPVILIEPEPVVAEISAGAGRQSVSAVPSAGVGSAHIIIFSFADESRARQSLDALVARGETPTIIPPFGQSRNYRVAIARYATMAEARANIQSYRREYGNDAWVLEYKSPAAIRILEERTGRTYVIFSSFTNQEQAFNMAAALTESGLNAEIIPPFGSSRNYRVAIAGYGTLAEAQAALPRYRQEHGEDLWLLRY